MNIRYLLSSILILISSLALAEEHEAHEAHVHGEAEMTIILQGEELALSFESPAANLVGFEHQPETDEQRNAVDAALLSLQDPNSWLQFDGGNCTLVSSAADTSLNSDHADDGHTEFSASYLYHCDQASKIESLFVGLQSTYPAIEHIDAQWIINDKQGITELEADNPRLLFK